MNSACRAAVPEGEAFNPLGVARDEAVIFFTVGTTRSDIWLAELDSGR